MAHSPLDHVLDTDPNDRVWPIFEHFGIAIPLPPPFDVFGHTFLITKFMLLELIVAVLMLVIFIPLCRWAAKGDLPRGPWKNAFESLLTFIRNEVAKPNIGEHDADRYVPLLWTMFLFILFCNLLGMVPLMGSPTASVFMTLGLALLSFILMHAAPIAKHMAHESQHLHLGSQPLPMRLVMGLWIVVKGVFLYLKSMWPPIEIDFGVPLVGPLLAFVIGLMIFVIELAGTAIKGLVLAVRLFANMFAGHIVLAMLLLGIVVAGEKGPSFGWAATAVISVLGVVALSLLELFVAFLQAYIFVFLTSLFMGMAMHPEH
jgi:F-type H+-transporting ATPase subunit a